MILDDIGDHSIELRQEINNGEVELRPLSKACEASPNTL